LLVTNEIISSRAAVLSSNIERLGVRNVLVTNESTDKLATFFPGFFDKILVDAPCSGEGMFRKDETAIKEWSPENVSLCAERQKEILNNASRMCRPGGIIVYSTCTFSEAENEDNVRWFLNEHPEFSFESSERLMPHKIKGEGHFVARFVKSCNISCKARENNLQNESKMTETNRRSKNSKAGNGKSGIASDADIRKFLTEECKIAKESVDTLFENSVLNTFGDNYYLTPTAVSSLKGLTVVRPGLQICKDLKNRFEPSHSLAMSLRPFEVSTMVNLDINDGNKYIEGQTVNCDPGLKGWVCVFINGYSIGWGKASNGNLKNHYPKGLRRVI
ncbi:MAG: RsmB/NOP family class I SAM-dependent RNA methyltransferase, partial [Lachnospiraceae bacterium]|nr:RsmB/NOP family class I SAM-dependent RNA methyltransferase [Lachnospiraceae bacterium]